MKYLMFLIVAAGVVGIGAQQYDIIVKNKNGESGEPSQCLRVVETDSLIFKPLPSRGLLLHYPFIYSGDRVVKDFSGNGNDGEFNTPGSAPSKRQDRFGSWHSAVGFLGDPGGEFILIPNLIDGLSELTISFWANPRKHDGKWRWIYGTTPVGGTSLVDVGIAIHEAYLTYHFRTTTEFWRNTSFFEMDTLEWTHVAVTYDGIKFQAYINGSVDRTHEMTGTVSTKQNQRIGFGYLTSAKEYFNGAFDDLRIYNRALSREEVLVLRYEGEPRVQ